MRSLVRLRSKLDVCHGGDQVLDDTRLGRVDSSVKRGHLGVELRFETSIHLHFISSLLIDEKDAVSILCFVSSPRRSLVSSRTSFTIAAYRASRSARYAAISTFASSTAARNRAVFSALAIASTRLTSVIALVDRSTTSFIQSHIHSFIHALARRRPHAPSLAAPTMACASFSAIMSLEIPSARVASMIARSNARRLPSPVSSLESRVSRSSTDPRGFPFLHETDTR